MDVEPAAPPPGAHSHRRDRRDFVAAIPMPDDRRVAEGRPGAPDVGNQQEATFVEEHQMGVQALRVFFTATQRYRVQRAMAASSRWTTRRRFRRQGFEAAPTHHLAPEDHRTVRTPEPAGHLRDRGARLQQLNPAPSPSLQLLGASLWSHASRVSREAPDVYYLRTRQ